MECEHGIEAGDKCSDCLVQAIDKRHLFIAILIVLVGFGLFIGSMIVLIGSSL